MYTPNFLLICMFLPLVGLVGYEVGAWLRRRQR